MPFIQSPEHLENFIKSIYDQHKESINSDLLMVISSYYPLLQPEGLVDKFSWSLKTDPKILEQPSFLKWLKFNKPFPYTVPKYTEILFNRDFLDRIRSLDTIPGVYSFWTEEDDPLYIGVSVNLMSRIVSSFAERFRSYQNVMYARVLPTNSYSDACVIEAYFIAKLKPVFNSTGCHGDNLTVKLIPETDLGERILCNEVAPASVMQNFKKHKP